MSCARTHEVEAARDGRIADARGLDVHVTTCAACRARAAELDAIARAIRAQPIAPDDELAARRARHRLVEAFAIERRVSRVPRGWWLAAAAVVAIGALWLVASRRSSERASPADAVAVSGIGARWTRSDDGATTRVTIDDGTLTIGIDHRAGAPRVVVVVPDGEIDDLGTMFDVTVRERRLASVSVREGALVVRLRGRDPVVVEAGRTWTAEPVAAVLAPPAPPARADVVAPQPAPPVRDAPRRALTPVAASLAIDAIDRELAQAVAALDRSEYAAAIRTLRAIVVEHGGDPRAEDAAYLLVVASQRSGDADGMREAARDYLRRYPHGFRRAAVQAIEE